MSKSRWLAQTLLLDVCDAPKAQDRQIAGPGLSLRDIAGSKNLPLRWNAHRSIKEFDAVAEAAELADHSGCALLL
jgi:hypothetical protein